MKFGLNIPKKKAVINRSISQPSKAFQQEEEEEEDDNQSMSIKELEKRHKQRINQQISKSSAITQIKIKEAQEKALKEDPNIFDYDAVYDDLKEAEERKNKAKKKADEKKEAKYIHNLLEMADIRKKDRLLAEEKKIAREREAEGDQYNDKEIFMTESYKKQKAELERIEAEERQREEEAAKKSNINIFYKQFLDKKDEERRAILKASKEIKSVGNIYIPSKEAQKNVEEKRIIEEAKQKGIQLNDSNEIVDKRELLGAGLNIATKPKFGTFASLASSDDRIKERQEEYEAYKRKKVEEYNTKRKQSNNIEEREKLSKEIERQLVEVKQKEDQSELVKQQALQKSALTRRTTDDAVLSAKERYLARKKQKTGS